MKKIKFKKGIRKIYFPIREADPYKAFEAIEAMDLPKYRLMGYEILRYTGKDGFTTYPAVYIEK